MMTHPIKQVCQSKKITYEEFSVLVNHHAGEDILSPEYIPILVCGARKPSPKLAAAIEKAFPEIKKEDLVWPKASNG